MSFSLSELVSLAMVNRDLKPFGKAKNWSFFSLLIASSERQWDRKREREIFMAQQCLETSQNTPHQVLPPTHTVISFFLICVISYTVSCDIHPTKVLFHLNPTPLQEPHSHSSSYWLVIIIKVLCINAIILTFSQRFWLLHT